jgi:hypothetical protein
MIEQVRFAGAVSFFRDKFSSRWNLQDLTDTNAPALFIGVYNQDDIDAVNAHQGFKVLMITHILPHCFNSLSPANLWIMRGNNMPCDVDQTKYKVKSVNVQMKDYSKFKPTVLGDKIYCYLGDWAQKDYYKYSLAEQLKSLVKHEFIYGFIDKSKPETLTDEYLINEIYAKCFVNLQMSTHGGRVGAIEMGYMGRNTIFSSSVDEIVKRINLESSKIGTIQQSVIEPNFFNDEWKRLSFWNENL